MSCSWSLMWIGRIMEIYRGQKIFRCWQWKKLKIPSRYFSVHLFQKGSRSFNFRCNAPVRRIKMSENLEEKIFWLKNQLRRSKSIHQLSLVKKIKRRRNCLTLFKLQSVFPYRASFLEEIWISGTSSNYSWYAQKDKISSRAMLQSNFVIKYKVRLSFHLRLLRDPEWNGCWSK